MNLGYMKRSNAEGCLTYILSLTGSSPPGTNCSWQGYGQQTYKGFSLTTAEVSCDYAPGAIMNINLAISAESYGLTEGYATAALYRGSGPALGQLAWNYTTMQG
jgi:hypothetical protein